MEVVCVPGNVKKGKVRHTKYSKKYIYKRLWSPAPVSRDYTVIGYEAFE